MRRNRTPVFISATVLLLTSLFVLRLIASVDRSGASAPSNASFAAEEIRQVEEIRGYDKWTRVNPVPVKMDFVVATACAAPDTIRRTRDKDNPHFDKFITVYVNETGRRAMMDELKPQFPEGSVIVKEKLAAPDSSTPELLTVMIKRAKGFNPESGDWEYMVTNGAGLEVQARGKIASCQSCHMSERTTDFVFRNYLPRSVQEAQR